MVELVNDAALGVVYSKEWLVWEDDSQVGITLGHLKPLKKVGSVDFIDAHMPKYTFSHPNRFATQFAQIALIIEKASFEDMHTKGFVQKGCAFAGHSLSEYSVFASIADVLYISALVDTVFYRGITMQRAVEHHAHNRSNYAMCTANPSCILKTFSDTAMREVVDTIATRTSTLLEIINYSIEVSTPSDSRELCLCSSAGSTIHLYQRI